MPSLADIWRQIGQVGQNPYLDPRVMAQGENLPEGGQYGVPVTGDISGILSDAYMYATDPESRRWPNYLMSAAGVLPGIPAASQLARAAGEASEMTPEALKFFGQKHVREAARQKKLAKQTAAAEAGKVVAKQKGAGTRAKVDPDVYKQVYAEQGLPAVLEAGQRGEHLKPAPGGGYIGAPRTVLTGQELGAMRRGLDREIAEGAAAIEYADPERLATWYDRAKAGQAASNEPYQLPRSLEEHAVYSAGASPEIETAFALRHHNAGIFGTGETAYRGAGRETLDSAVRENRPADLAFKIGEYRGKNDPRVVENSPFGVNDFRMAQTFGYTTPEGLPWRAGVQNTMHPFMDMETAMAIERANQRGVGGKTDWTGATSQEVPWVYGKAQDLYARGVGGRFPEGPEGMAMALREANNTMADYLPKHTASATYEYTPGADTGHRADVLDMPYEERLRYGDVGRWDQPIPEAPLQTPHGAVGAGPRDVLYGAMGMRQLPALESVGNYTNRAGVRETNPVTIGRPLVDFQNLAQSETGLANAINPPTLEALRFAERFRGANDVQEASALNLPVTMGARTGKLDVLLDRGAPPTANELSEITNRLAQIGMGGDVSATNRGMMIFSGVRPYGDDTVKAAKARQAQVLEALPEGVPSAREGFYESVSAPEALAGRGIATGRVLGQAGRRTPAEAVRGVSESEAVRRVIREKIARDAGQPGTRADVQKMRDFFANENWQPVVDLIRKGYKPAAAMAALGYSMQGMAAEDLQEIADARD